MANDDLNAELEDFSETIEFTDINYRVEWLAPAYRNSDILRNNNEDFPVGDEDGDEIRVKLLAESLFKSLKAHNITVQFTKWTDTYRWANGLKQKTTVIELLEEFKGE